MCPDVHVISSSTRKLPRSDERVVEAHSPCGTITELDLSARTSCGIDAEAAETLTEFYQQAERHEAASLVLYVIWNRRVELHPWPDLTWSFPGQSWTMWTTSHLTLGLGYAHGRLRYRQLTFLEVATPCCFSMDTVPQL